CTAMERPKLRGPPRSATPCGMRLHASGNPRGVRRRAGSYPARSRAPTLVGEIPELVPRALSHIGLQPLTVERCLSQTECPALLSLAQHVTKPLLDESPDGRVLASRELVRGC